MEVALESGDSLAVEHPGEWPQGSQVEVVIRAQRCTIYTEEEADEVSEENVFKGTITDRSYMGGEVSYFITLESGIEMHAISQVKLQALKIGMPVIVGIAPRRCGLLPVDKDQ